MKKGIVAGLIVLCVALGAGTAAVVVTDDRKGPEIELPADGDARSGQFFFQVFTARVKFDSPK